MKRLLIAASALALGTAAFAGPGTENKPVDPTAQTLSAPERQAIIDQKLADAADQSAETQVYDGPDSYTASQPPPDKSYDGAGGPEFDDEVVAQRLDTYQPIARDAYPACSTSVTDNCTQRYDPGN